MPEFNPDILNRLKSLRKEQALWGHDDHFRVACTLFGILLELGIAPADMYGIGQNLCKLTF